MSTPSPAPRRGEIRSGQVYRRIPSYYADARGRISYKAFRPQLKDRGGLSVDLDLQTAIANLKTQERPFHLAVLDVEKIRTGTSAWVSEPTAPGASHTRIENCESIDTQQALAGIATIIPVP